MNVFISGGCKNGKSMYAQKLAKETALREGKKLYYVATMRARDMEDENRIKRHREERKGWGFRTIEQSCRITSLLSKANVDPTGVFLIDSVTALLENEIFDEEFNFDEYAHKRVTEDLINFALNTGNVIFVSDYIYGDGIFYGEVTEKYRKSLAYVDRALAKFCESVKEAVAGRIIDYKQVENNRCKMINCL